MAEPEQAETPRPTEDKKSQGVSCCWSMSKDDKAKAKKLKEKADDVSRMARILKRRSDEQRAKKKTTRPPAVRTFREATKDYPL
jgi:hypothetical protein